MMKVAKDKSPGLRRWVVGAFLTVCIVVPTTVFARPVILPRSITDGCSDVIEDPETGETGTNTAFDCLLCIDINCTAHLDYSAAEEFRCLTLSFAASC